MHRFSHPDESEKQPIRLTFHVPAIKHILQWITTFIKLTSEEQQNAGIYLNGEGRD